MAERERERMEYDVVIVGGRAVRPRRGDPSEAAGRRSRDARSPSASSRRAPRSAPTSCRARCSSRARSTSCSRTGRNAARRSRRRSPRTGSCSWASRQPGHLPAADAAADAQPRQLHRLSLGNLCRWLAQQAEALGVEIYPGFAAVRGAVRRRTARCRASRPANGHRPGRPADRATTSRASSCIGQDTLFAEGCAAR